MKFFILNNAFKRSAIEVKPLYEDYGLGEIIEIDSILKKENEFKIMRGKKWFDYLMIYSDINYIISNKFRDLLIENNVTGWETIPIQIENHPDVEYYIFIITSVRAGRILNLEARNNYEEEFIKFDGSKWDGSDFFSLENTALECCTERVKELIEKAKLTNIEFEEMIAV